MWRHGCWVKRKLPYSKRRDRKISTAYPPSYPEFALANSRGIHLPRGCMDRPRIARAIRAMTRGRLRRARQKKSSPLPGKIQKARKVFYLLKLALTARFERRMDSRINLCLLGRSVSFSALSNSVNARSKAKVLS